MARKDQFFVQETCDRCGGPLDGGRIMSMYNEDCICMECKLLETKRSDYDLARSMEIAAVRAGNYNYKGMKG